MKIFILIFSIFLQEISFSQNSLILGSGADAVGLAEALTSHISTNSIRYNPATFQFANKFTTSFSQTMGFGDTKTNSVFVSFEKEATAVAFNLFSTSINDLEYRVFPGDPIGKFNYRFIVLQGSYAIKYSEELSVGATLKSSYEKIFIDEAFGLYFDLGILAKLNSNLNIGASLSNIGLTSKLNNESSSIPNTLRLGLNYTPINDLILLSDVVLISDQKYKLHFGTQYSWNILTLQSGYQFGYETKSLTFGFKIKYSTLSVQYAYQPLNFDLGNVTSFDISFEL